jgi:hypothetical protein
MIKYALDTNIISYYLKGSTKGVCYEKHDKTIRDYHNGCGNRVFSCGVCPGRGPALKVSKIK